MGLGIHDVCYRTTTAAAPRPPAAAMTARALLAIGTLLVQRAACTPPPVGGYGPLDVRSFGAKGDGVTDDAPAIQKAIDHAQQVSALQGPTGPSRPVYFPAGLYLVNSSLKVVSTHVKGTNKRLALSLRLFGDGMAQSVVMAGAPMDAVLRFEGHGPQAGAAGVTTNGHTVESLEFNAAGLANYSVAATAITRSLFRYSDFSGARIAGLFLGWGWINDVLECYFTGNLIGVYLDNAVNSVNVVDGNFESNHGVGIIVNSGAMVRLEGNEMESMGGPGIIVNSVSALTVRSNYFEANNQHGNDSLALAFVDHHSGAHEKICTDILLNGYPTWGPERSNGKDAFVIPAPPSQYKLALAPIPLSNENPCSGVIIAANSHSPGHDSCPGNTFAGVHAAGAEGLSATASHAGGCIGGKHYHYSEVVLTDCDHAKANTCGGKNTLWTALKSESVDGEYLFQSALHGAVGVNSCYVLNIPEDLSLGGFQVVAYGAAQCPTSSGQSSFKIGSSGLLQTTGFKTTKCDSTTGCCVQAGPTQGNATSLAMAVCNPKSPLQQFDVESNLDGKTAGRIRDKATGLCMAIKDCKLETDARGGKPARTCVAVGTGNAPDANSSLAAMEIKLNTGDFAANQ
jgi:hypothetical protein